MSSPSFLFNVLSYCCHDNPCLGLTTTVFLVSRRNAFAGSLIPFLSQKNQYAKSEKCYDSNSFSTKLFASVFSHSSSLQFATYLSIDDDGRHEFSDKINTTITNYIDRFPFYPPRHLQKIVLSRFICIDIKLLETLSLFQSLRSLVLEDECLIQCERKQKEMITNRNEKESSLSVFSQLEELDIRNGKLHGEPRFNPFLQLKNFGVNSLKSVTWPFTAIISEETIDFFNSLNSLEHLALPCCQLIRSVLKRNPLVFRQKLKSLSVEGCFYRTDSSTIDEVDIIAMLSQFTIDGGDNNNSNRPSSSCLRKLNLSLNNMPGIRTKNILKKIDGLQELSLVGCASIFRQLNSIDELFCASQHGSLLSNSLKVLRYDQVLPGKQSGLRSVDELLPNLEVLEVGFGQENDVLDFLENSHNLKHSLVSLTLHFPFYGELPLRSAVVEALLNFSSMLRDIQLMRVTKCEKLVVDILSGFVNVSKFGVSLRVNGGRDLLGVKEKVTVEKTLSILLEVKLV